MFVTQCYVVHAVSHVSELDEEVLLYAEVPLSSRLFLGEFFRVYEMTIWAYVFSTFVLF